MSTTLLLTLQDPDEPEAIRRSGVEVLAEYPDSMLVRASDEQAVVLAEHGIEAAALPDQPVQVTGASFEFDAAVRAQDENSLEPRSGRTAYYLVQLAGPPSAAWLATIRGLGAEIHSSLPGFTLLVGMLPERVDELRANPWVQQVTPFRPAMKVSPKLRAGHDPTLDAADLTAVAADDLDVQDAELVEIAVFRGESVQDVAGEVRNAGGTVVTTLPESLVVSVSAATVAELADREGVQAILPYTPAELHNDQAATIMSVPGDHDFGGLKLTGEGQIVGIADSGLDGGDPATVHKDLRGRVAGVASWPTRPSLASLINDPPGRDDGPADRNSGHGSHVAGSVLGNGSAAVAAGSKTVPAGTAPEARVFFQAIEQSVQWKPAAQLIAEGIPVPNRWPPKATSLWGLPDDLATLFQQAYTAGARIHTNSWGAPVAGAYTVNSRAVDEFMWQHPDILILFSAGNEGVDDDRDGLIDPDSIGSPGTAKNCLTVGASENNRPAMSDPPPGNDANWADLRWPRLGAAGHVSDDVNGLAAFSSRGPTDDARIKPDVVAPGTNVLSTLSTAFPANKEPLWGRLPVGHPLRSAYCWSGGTSMATPLVAGAAVLVRQYLIEQREHVAPGRKPSGALIKAILVNGATAMAGQFPGEVPTGANPVTGFGRINLTQSIISPPLGRPHFADDADDAVTTGEIRGYQIHNVDTNVPLKVTLAWTDAPAPTGIGGLENQLYLQLVSPDGAVVDGDVTPFPTARNNVQQVVIANPIAGDYRIRVRGVSVIRQAPGAGAGPNPRQDFALVVSNGTDLN